MAALLALSATALPATAAAEIYNPTTAEYIPTSYYYPPPSPSYDPPPPYFPPLELSFAGGGGGSESTTGGDARSAREERILGYARSAKVSRQANRQMAAVFARRLGKGNFDRARFVKEADKGTFRVAFRKLVRPLGWSDTDYADAIAAYSVSSYMIANGIEELTLTERIGAGSVDRRVRERLLGDARMRKISARGKQIATERLNTVTVVQLVQFAAGDPTARATQQEATRRAGLKTFKGDLTTVQLGADGFEPRSG
ncbi:MAG TPA: hypothetical protein VMF55_00420 [Solirubrobacterales bacterium]|nr:hypothetical protein [Solirubrobacterales bacterium]